MRPYRHIPFIATAIAALVCPLARAEELPASGPLPLGDVVAYARAHNPELEAAHQRQAAARAVPAQAAAWDDPTLAAESWNSPRAVPYDAAGMGGQPDVRRAAVERPHIGTRLVATRLERERAAAPLNELLSRGPEEPLGTPVDPGPAHLPGPLDRLIALARAHHPELAVRGAAVAREQDDVALARRSYLPDFDLTFERFYNRVGRDGYGAMIAMTLPLPFKYRRDAALDEAHARLASEEAMRRRAEDRTAAAVKRALAALEAAAAERELLAGTHLPQAEQSFAASREAYVAGNLDFTALVDSLRTIESTHLEHHEAAAAFEKAYASLETAVGGELPREERP